MIPPQICNTMAGRIVNPYSGWTNIDIQHTRGPMHVGCRHQTNTRAVPTPGRTGPPTLYIQLYHQGKHTDDHQLTHAYTARTNTVSQITSRRHESVDASYNTVHPSHFADALPMEDDLLPSTVTVVSFML